MVRGGPTVRGDPRSEGGPQSKGGPRSQGTRHAPRKGLSWIVFIVQNRDMRSELASRSLTELLSWPEILLAGSGAAAHGTECCVSTGF